MKVARIWKKILFGGKGLRLRELKMQRTQEIPMFVHDYVTAFTSSWAGIFEVHEQLEKYQASESQRQHKLEG